MSAYIVSPKHVAALAAFAAKRDRDGAIIYEYRVNSSPMEGARKVAEELMRENIRSVATRYPNDPDGDRPGPCDMSDAQLVEEAGELAERYYFASERLRPLDIYAMAGSLEYQSCENEDYYQTLAYRQLERIKDAAVRSLPGYDKAIRDYEGELHSDVSRDAPKPVLLSSLVKSAKR